MFTGADAASAIGKKYTELFPRILMHDKEAVAQIFTKRRSANLKECHFQCLSRHRQADIRLTPIRNGSDSLHQVQIDIAPSEPCSIGQQLIDSQKLIAIGKIAATLAHGVRNPLNAIKGAIVYLRDQYAHETQLIEFTDILEAEMSRLENFISRFLSTTTFDSDIALVDVNELIQKIKVFISLQTHTQDIRCDYLLEDIPRIEISAFHLEQALLNVINNSLEAMGSGGTLTIRTSRRSGSPQSFIAIEISDTGRGIDLPSLSSVADHPVRKHGRGFGLFIADEIVKFYKGHLKLLGEKGKGTTVTLLLPAPDIEEGDHL
jgi:two-component system nitrogen regulation sensor histidine kinase GlnL